MPNDADVAEVTAMLGRSSSCAPAKNDRTGHPRAKSRAMPYAWRGSPIAPAAPVGTA